MASEPRDRSVPPELPDSLDEWLESHAEQREVSKGELLAELVSAYRVAVDGDVADADELAAAMGLDEREDQLRQSFERRLDAVEERNEKALNDVRRRVVQLKEATQRKAPADHSHPELDRVDDLAATVEAVETTVEEVEATLDDHEAHLESVADDLADARGKLTQVARVVVQLRSEADAHEVPEPSEPDALADIRREAARKHVRKANCGACGESVSVALLPEAACPHCRAPFDSIEGSSGLLSKARLVGPKPDGETE